MRVKLDEGFACDLFFQDIDIQPSTPLLLRIIAEELDENGMASGETTNADIAIIIDDVLNHPPQFLQKSYIASIDENSAEGTTLEFLAGFDKVQDFDKVSKSTELHYF